MEGQFQLLFDKMKIEMQNQTAELKDSITKSIMDKMDEKLIPIVEENKNLKINLEKLEKELEYLKRREKSNNIIVFGLEEKEKTSFELLQKIKRNLKQDINIEVDDCEVNKIYRLGNKNKESKKPRPVLCSFINNWKKTEIIKNKKNLKDIYITEDYSKEVLEKRKKLQAELVKEREKGNIAYLKHDKLIVKESNNIQEKRKREVSTSPSISPSSHSNQPKKQQTIPPFKPNVTNAFNLMRPRASSLSNTSDAINININNAKQQ